MKSLLIFCLLISASLVLQAQVYYPIKPREIFYYSTQDKMESFALKIDSVKTEGNDSVYYLLKQVRKANRANCNYTALGDSWLGDSIRTKQDGSCILVNRFKQPFLIKTKARLNEKWIAFTLSDWKAEITVTSVSKETHLQSSDSIKILTINILNSNGVDINHKYDGLVISLSKSSGFVRIFKVYNFGTDASDFLEIGVKSLYLAGKESFPIGLRNITGKEVYDFEPGDIFHREQSYSNYSDYTRVKTLDTIMERSQDNLGYSYKVKRKTETNINNVFTTKLETIEMTYSFNQLTAIPRTASAIEDLSIFVYSADFKRWGKETRFDLRKDESNCVNEIIDGGWCHWKYYQGVGGPYYDCQNMFGVGRSISTLVYIKKLNEEWGKPLVLDIENNPAEYQTSVSPNPAKDYLQVQISGNMNNVILYLKDISGMNVLYREINSVKGNIDISGLKPGLYFYSLSNADKIIKTGKIIIE